MERTSTGAIFWTALKLGLTSFGGPVAHLGYFREEYVVKKRWLDEAGYAELVALCQFLPGPASSQVGIGIGLLRGGWLGAAAAWLGFTLPSALALALFAWLSVRLGGGDLSGAGWLHGLKIAAVAVVAQAVWGMGRSFAPDRIRLVFVLAAAVVSLLWGSAWTQPALLVLGGLAGWRWLGRLASSAAPAAASAAAPGSAAVTAASSAAALPASQPLGASSGPPAAARAASPSPPPASAAAPASASFSGLAASPASAPAPASRLAAPVSRRTGAVLLLAFAALLLALPAARSLSGAAWLAWADSFYRAGALVFGGGHVVLPLLEQLTVPSGWVTHDQFLAGYGAAQAVPGPLFTFAAYLGYWAGGWLGVCVAVAAIFLPAFLLVVGVLPFWSRLSGYRPVRGALLGVNAAVVGLLLAALYDPVWVSAIRSPRDAALALTAFGLLVYGKTPPWAVVALCALGGSLLQFFA